MTTRFIEKLRDSIALFICGEFALTAGARVARHPGEYGIRETWHVAGDEFSTTLFYGEAAPSKTPADRERIDAAVDRLARSWWLHRYPWAGSLSTAHTLLWYDRYGADIFRRPCGDAAEIRRAILRQEAYSPAARSGAGLTARSGARSGDLADTGNGKTYRYAGDPSKAGGGIALRKDSLLNGELSEIPGAGMLAC